MFLHFLKFQSNFNGSFITAPKNIYDLGQCSFTDKITGRRRNINFLLLLRESNESDYSVDLKRYYKKTTVKNYFNSVPYNCSHEDYKKFHLKYNKKDECSSCERFMTIKDIGEVKQVKEFRSMKHIAKYVQRHLRYYSKKAEVNSKSKIFRRLNGKLF